MNDMGGQFRAAAQVASRRSIPLGLVVLTVRVAEVTAVILAASVAFALWQDRIAIDDAPAYVRAGLSAAVLFALFSELAGAYDLDARFSLRRGWQRIATAWGGAVLGLITVGFLVKASEIYSRGWAITWFLTGGAMLLATRVAMTIWILRLKRHGVFNSRAAIFGASAQGQRLARYVQRHDKLTLTLVGFFDDRRDGRVPMHACDLPVLGTLDDLVEAIRAEMIDQVIVALPWSAEARIQQVVQKLSLTPVRIRLAPDLASFAFAHRPVVLLGEVPVLTLFERPISGADALWKAAEDRLLAALFLVLLSPFMLAIALAIRLDSPGPIFFRQPREGFNNRPFRVWKYRSMTHDRCEVDGITQVSRGDKRVTRVGAVIRATSLDELPQLFNVIAGDMSLVGPRPHAPSTRAGGRLFHEVVATYAARHKVKPGITGWAQVCGWRGETDTEDKLVKRLDHDLYYIENWSIGFDLYILLRTIAAVVVPRNAF